MQVKKTTHSQTEVTLTIIPKTAELAALKEHTLGHFQSRVKVAGFREGKAPLNLVEKQIDPNALQQEFLEEAINQLYPEAVRTENIRPVDRPEITIKKFVPFTELEFEAKVAVVGQIKLPDYTKIKKPLPTVKVTAADVDGVIESLRTRLAEKIDVDRATKTGDQVWIDFKGTDAKGQPVKGADGKDYPLELGSKTFIPGFEENVEGLKAGESKTFELTFPKDYGVKALSNKKITFEVTVTKVQEIVRPATDDNFAAKAGPFKTMAELKADITKQLTMEREREAGLDYESELIREITAKSKLVIPEVMVADQVERMLAELKQNLSYRGQTYQEFLESETKTEEQYRKEVLAPQAEERVKASLVLAEVAEKEKIEVTPEELEIRLQTLKGQYQDAAMQAELDKPEARRDIAMRMLSEKTVAKLSSYATSGLKNA
jgi:trigger factor